MKTKTKVWLITAAFLVLIGCILFVGVMTALEWDFNALATVEYKTNIHEIREDFDSISIDSDTADIVFLLSDDGKCRAECREQENTKHSVTVENGTLNVKQTDERTVRDLIGLNFDTPKITVYLPEREYLSLCVKVSTGDICVEGINVGALDLTVSTGKVTLTDISCKSVISNGSTGDILLKNVVAAEKLFIERSTGDVKLVGSDAAEICIKTDTGDVTGSLLTDKTFVAQSDTGRVDVPKNVSGGRCEISTDTGNIKITVEKG